MKFEIVLDTKINSIEEVYNNLSGNGEFLKMFNTKLNVEVDFYPEINKIEMITIFGDELLDEIVPLKSFEMFCEEFPTTDWYYGYIND